MTCRKVESLFESGAVSADVALAQRSELTEHAAECTQCRLFLREHSKLVAGLALLRSSAPQTSATLDVTVLSNFRCQIVAFDDPDSRRWFDLRWGVLRRRVAAAALTILIFAAILLRPKPAPVQIAVVPPVQRVPPSPPTQSAAQNTVPLRKRTRVKSVAPVRQVHGPGAYDSSLTAGFRSLMFCDAISCNGNMELVRIQLPSSAMPLSASAQPRPASAEVLIGEDGVARAIRIVE